MDKKNVQKNILKTVLLTKNSVTMFKNYRHKINDIFLFYDDKFLIFFCGKGFRDFLFYYFRTFRMKNAPKIPQNYCCELCHYNTCNLKDYKRHLSTDKHQNRTILNVLEQKNPKNPHDFICKKCNKCYKARNSLWYHEKKCISSTTIDSDQSKINGMDKDELIIMLLKQNADLIKGQQDMMKGQQDITMEIVKNGVNNTNTNTNHSHNTTNNSHNKAFNLNLFLNETCKNAMNITDFIDSIKLQLNDFMEVGEVGYVQGISNIIVKNLNSLDETLRPIHCTDQKRETFYVKDENIWEKEEEDKKKIKKMIRSIAFKNEKLMKTYKETYPDYNDPDSKHSDQYSKTVIEALGGTGENESTKQEKIIKNISKVTTIKQK